MTRFKIIFADSLSELTTLLNEEVAYFSIIAIKEVNNSIAAIIDFAPVELAGLIDYTSEENTAETTVKMA